MQRFTRGSRRSSRATMRLNKADGSRTRNGCIGPDGHGMSARWRDGAARARPPRTAGKSKVALAYHWVDPFISKHAAWALFASCGEWTPSLYACASRVGSSTHVQGEVHGGNSRIRGSSRRAEELVEGLRCVFDAPSRAPNRDAHTVHPSLPPYAQRPAGLATRQRPSAPLRGPRSVGSDRRAQRHRPRPRAERGRRPQ